MLDLRCINYNSFFKFNNQYMAAFLIPERCTWARGAWACASLLASVVTVTQAILRRQLEEGTKHRRYYFTSAGLTMYLLSSISTSSDYSTLKSEQISILLLLLRKL